MSEFALIVKYFIKGGRRPSILPVPDMISGSTINLAAVHQASTEDSEDEIDDVPWRAPSEKIT